MIWLLTSLALAESWCAGPLIAHEWGVTVLLPEGGVVDSPPTPSWLHHDDTTTAQGAAVRTLPADGGERELPVVHFYAPQPWSDQVPLGVEVGFQTGAASTWYPAVSARTPPDVANGAAAAKARRQLVAERGSADLRGGVGRDLGRDPTKQLHWDRLMLTKEALTPPRDPQVSWVTAARAVPDALWVNGPGESERFLFYEGRTVEPSALIVEAGDSGKPHHYVLRNRSAHDVHDVVFVHDGKAWTAPRIPAGKTAGFLLVDPYDATAAKTWLRQRWVDDAPIPPVNYQDCEMMRDPAIPVETASGHRMFAAELDVLFGAWDGRLLEGGDRLIYREDPAALDQIMPLALYSDMFHTPQIRRLGVVLVPGDVAP